MIRCSDYDYIEIACMYRYPVVLTLKSGDRVTGTAKDTSRNDKREECMTLIHENSEIQVVLDHIATLAISVDNPHFSEVRFP